MNKLFRLASKDDYTYVPEIGMWELDFDKRPLTGVRCDNPEVGAFEYNQARLKFFNASRTSNSKPQELDFEAVLNWAANNGSPAQCQFVLKLLYAANISEYQKIALDFMRLDKKNYPYHLDLAIFFTGFQSRLTTKHNIISLIKDRAKS